jgi:protein ImuB
MTAAAALFPPPDEPPRTRTRRRPRLRPAPEPVAPAGTGDPPGSGTGRRRPGRRSATGPRPAAGPAVDGSFHVRPLPGSRTLVVWCPDWPAVAAARHAGVSAAGPAAVFHANRVQACTAAARAEGIRVGMRRRDAQSRCPELAVLPVDPDRDARLFEPVAAAVEAVAPGIEVLRPGMVACQVRGPARYFGSETAAAERLVDAVEALDVECRIGIADVLPVAVLAARRSTIVPHGGDGDFCARLPIVELARDPAIAPPERGQLVDLLVRLGITTAGEFAALPADKVATRFGPDGVVMHQLAAGRAERGLSRRRIDADLSVEQSCDPPLDRVDTAAFAARALAARFHDRLAGAGLACTRLAITASTERGATLTRIWHCARPLTAAATADRLRWQLDGWLTGSAHLLARSAAAQMPGRPGAPAPGRPGAITRLRLEPVEAVGAGLIQYGLWGSDGQDDHRAGWAFARIQGLLGPEAVLTPALSGGRGPADRVTLVAWGEQKTPERDPAAPWPGALPAPSPSRLGRTGGAAADPVGRGTAVTAQAGRRIRVTDPAGHEVHVTDRGLLTGTPAAADGRRVVSWAGPWLLDERWWAGAGSGAAGSLVTAPAAQQARMQVTTDAGPPVLLGYGPGGWHVEAVYD